jgi:23S rRNA (cytosine1962-C5)-methyltransferase
MTSDPKNQMTDNKNKQQNYPRVILSKGREVSIKRFHPWIFSGAVQSISEHLKGGEIVEVFTSQGNYLGTGHFEDSSLAVKLFSFERKEINTAFWKQKIENAFNLRKALGLAENADTNAYRLVFTEGDGLPGLIIDIYDNIAVFQAQTQGMFNAHNEISAALLSVYNAKLQAVYDKSAESFFEPSENNELHSRFLHGQAETPKEITEHGNSFLVDFVKGQKTGFFLDQRENRALLGQYAQGRKVLNLFSYTGGFSVYALKSGAKEVYSIDSAASAIELANANIKLNGFEETKHIAIIADVKNYVQEMASDFDLVILDPPAFAKHKASQHRAMQGYKFLNTSVLKKIKSGGILFTFSCSQVVGTDLFESTVMASAIEAGRSVRILHRLSQPPDHPVSIFHPEGVYLKGLVVYVD